MTGTGKRFVLRTKAHVRDEEAVAKMGHPELRPIWWRVAAVVALSAVVGSGWLLTEAYPSDLGFPFAGCVHFSVLALAGLAAAKWPTGEWRRVAGLALAGLGVFALPGVVASLTTGSVPESTTVAMFCSVPLLVVLAVAWSGDGEARGLLMPSLAGLCGALLIFSPAMPTSLRRAVGLAATIGCCAVVAAAGVWMCRLMRGLSVAVGVAAVGFGGALVLGGYGLWVGWPRIAGALIGAEGLRCVVFDLPVVWVTVWLMREVSPVRLAARYLIAPVITWIEGYAMVRGTVEMRSAVALLLMLAGAALLLRHREGEEMMGLSLR